MDLNLIKIKIKDYEKLITPDSAGTSLTDPGTADPRRLGQNRPE
jgi:hypothetical protein